jgi:ketosteroid isomerase-like protein
MTPTACRSIFALSVSVLSVMSLSAQSPEAKPTSEAEQEVLKIEAEWYRAYLQSDSATMNRLEAEDFMVMTSAMPSTQFQPMRKGRNFGNRTEQRKAEMAAIQRRLEQVHVRFIGDVAIINAVQVQRGGAAAPNGEEVRSFYTSVWHKRKGAWQVLNAQFTPVPK